jgi:hypothetical protein
MLSNRTHNNSVFTRKRFLFLVLTLSVIFCACSGCVSGNFKLDPQSRLPASWFHNKDNIPREKLDVEIIIYETTTSPKGKVKVIISSNGKTIEEAEGLWWFHPKSLNRKIPAAEPPSWGIIEINGIKEIFEQKEKNDILRIVDDVDK